MKKLNLILMLFAFTLTIMLPINAKALTNFAGVEMTENQYNELVKVYGEDLTLYFTQEQFDIATNKKYKLLDKEERFIKTATYIDSNGKVRETYETELTKEEFNNDDDTSFYAICSESQDPTPVDNSCWETDSKRIIMYYYTYNDDWTKLLVNVIVRWKTQPKIRSYDIIGIRHNPSYKLNVAETKAQLFYLYDINNNYKLIDIYNPKVYDDGFGIVTKLPDTSTMARSIQIGLTAEFKRTDSHNWYRMYGAYTHARENVTYDQARTFFITPSGRGEVFGFENYTSNLINKYDNMQGVSVY